MRTTEPKPLLSPDRLYLGDNGRCFCGNERCAGVTASYTGRDLSGQEVYPLTAQDLAAMARDIGHAIRCETCGKEGRS
jgi:hypothetical protein